MNRIFKILTLWMLLLVLPVQAMATAVKISCGPNHHAMTSAPSKFSDTHVNQSGHDHQHDEHHLVQNSTIDTSIQAASDQQDGSNTIKHSTCSACATCCVGAGAPPSSLNLAAVNAPSFAPVLLNTSSFTGFIPAGLERPPRHLPF